MNESAKQAIRDWLVAILLVTLFAWFSKAYTRDVSGPSTVWLANGLLLGVMLSRAAARWPALLLAGFGGNVVGGLAVGDPAATAAAIALANTVEVALAAWPLRNRIEKTADFYSWQFVLRFTLAGLVLAPLASGSIVIGWEALEGGALNLPLLEKWCLAHALGTGIMAPVTLAFHRDSVGRLFRPGALLSLAALVLVTCLVFVQTRYPLLYVLVPPVMLVAMLGGAASTAAALLVVTSLAVGFTEAGKGPLMLIQASQETRYLMLQVFIGVLLLSMAPVLVLRGERSRARRLARASELCYRMLAEHSRDVIVLTDMDGRRIYVSPAIEQVLGWTPKQFRHLGYAEFVHPDQVDEAIAQAIPVRKGLVEANTAVPPVVLRARRRDGSDIWIESHVVWFRDDFFAELASLAAKAGSQATASVLNRGDDGSVGGVITLRDVTRRQLAEQQLEAATRELAALALKDGLTGLSNRRRFDAYLESEWERNSRTGQSLAVVMIDVDHFKLFNDCYGHQRGDTCLVDVATAITSGLHRAADLAARYGGEEFALVLPETSLADAMSVAERIRSSLVAGGAEHKGSSLGIVTASFGVAACVPEPALGPAGLLKAADEALYTSKSSGRNRCTGVTLEVPLAELAATGAPHSRPS